MNDMQVLEGQEEKAPLITLVCLIIIIIMGILMYDKLPGPRTIPHHIEPIPDQDTLLEEMMGALWEMKVILHQEEFLVDDHHLTTKDLKFQEGGELVDHLMEILEMMDYQMMEYILQDEDHQEEDLLDHQEEEEDLAPLACLEILDPRKEDLQVPLDNEDTEDPLDHKDL